MTQSTAIPKQRRLATLTDNPVLHAVRDRFVSLEVDSRLLGMIVALAIMGVVFNVLSDGTFLTARNLWNLSVQSTAVAVMATGMVLVIVSRNIDLSVGSIVVLAAMVMALLQNEWLPSLVGKSHPLTWVVTLAIGLGLGALIGGLQGFVVAYIKVPSFIVTLGGLLAWRGLAFEIAGGRTVAPLDATFQLLGGGPGGSLGESLSWLVAALLVLGFIYTLVAGRRRRRRYGFPLRPRWADLTLAVVGSLGVIGLVGIANAYPLPAALAKAYAEEHGVPIPPGGFPTGIALPVLILIAIAVAMTYLATRRRYGRYVYSIGGNPEAAVLAGINTRLTLLRTFILMGMLAALSAAIISARLNAATVGLGTGIELSVIAAAVIGGTSFAGGIGKIAGAVLGAVVMQSLTSGMVLLKIDTPMQDLVLGFVLVTAVAIDALLRRRNP